MKIADTADIRFECSKCGQHLVVEAAGAGVTADCPICNTTVTVPRVGADGRHSLTATIAPAVSRSAFADPLPDDLREELIDASMLNGKLVGDLAKAREENARLQQQLKTVGEKCEHLNASTTHTQAELKTFQVERQQFKAELSALRQKAATAEEVLAAREGELAQARAKLAASVPAGDLEAVEAQLAEARSLAAESQAKAVSAQQALDEAARSGNEWKAQTEVGAASLADALKLASDRESELKAAENALQESQKTSAGFEAKTTDLEHSLTAERTQREQLAAELESARKNLGETQPQLAALDDALHKTRWRLGEVEAALAGAQETGLRLTTERAEVQRQLEEARAQLAEAGDWKTQLSRSGDELRESSEKLRLAEESNQTLLERSEQLRRDADSLRRDLMDSHSGREVVELRARLDETETERERLATRLNSVEADLRAFTSTQAAARVELEQARAERDDAFERVESLRETRAAKDNQVLRGIIARLNADLAQRAAEVIRLKRGRYGLKITYVLFAIGFLAVVAFALAVLPHALKQ